MLCHPRGWVSLLPLPGVFLMYTQRAHIGPSLKSGSDVTGIPSNPTGSGSQELSFLESGIHFGAGHRSHVNEEEGVGGGPCVCVTG